MNMKLKIAGFAVIAALISAMFAAFSPMERQKEYIDNDGKLTVYFDGSGRENTITKVFTHDTLTTTEADTLNLGYILSSPYQYSYQLKVQKITGTPNLKAVLDQRNSLSNTDWIGIDSVSISGADSTRTYFLLEGANTWGIQQRLRLVGTTGENQYDITALLKKTVQ